MTCPVCKYESIPTLTTYCPNCASSLIGIILIDTLEEQYIDLVKDKIETEGKQIQQNKIYEQRIERKKKWNLLLLTLLVALPFLYYFFVPSKTVKETPPTVLQKDSLDIYKKRVADNEIEINALNRQLRAIEGTMDVREIKYKVKEGDRLYDLGILFYNDTAAWYQIALDNKIYDIRGLPKGDSINIKYRD